MADRFTLRLEENPVADQVARLGDGLTKHSLPHVGTPGFLPLAIFAYNEPGELVAGVTANKNWNWLHIQLIWVDETLRRSGLGTRLLDAIEAEGVKRGCTHAHLDTFSYQARPLYERRGYELFGTLDDYPPGHQRFFLRKSLT